MKAPSFLNKTKKHGLKKFTAANDRLSRAGLMNIVNASATLLTLHRNEGPLHKDLFFKSYIKTTKLLRKHYPRNSNTIEPIPIQLLSVYTTHKLSNIIFT